MNARETLKLISKQWCDISDLTKLAEIGKNNAVKLRREIKDELILKGYTLPNNRLPMIEVVNKLKININYLEKMAWSPYKQSIPSSRLGFQGVLVITPTFYFVECGHISMTY